MARARNMGWSMRRAARLGSAGVHLPGRQWRQLAFAMHKDLRPLQASGIIGPLFNRKT